MNERVRALDGNTFVVCDERGDIDASPTSPEGLFHQDMRFLSRWRLTVDGKPLNALSTDDLQYNRTQFFLAPGTGTIYVDADFSVVRRRSVGLGFHEDITILNHRPEAFDLTLQLDAAADFTDLFEVKDALAKKGRLYRRVKDGRLVLGYQRERFIRETWITGGAEARPDEHGLTWDVHVEPHGEWSTCVEVVAATDVDGSVHTRPKYGHDECVPKSAGEPLDSFLEGAPRIHSSWLPLHQIYQRSLTDLAALRFFPKLLPGAALPAAGLPWFMAIFGRDSLITSLQALPFLPSLAATTLRVLATAQGIRVDDFRESEPGKILHEMRLGEMAAFEERPHSPYYGAADSTPLFLVLLDEYERWTGDADLVRALEHPARAALHWIDRYGDRDGDGYIDYQRRNQETGLENQCWKDSWDSIRFADGTLPGFPRALCEIQGYAYDAKMRCARLARKIWGDAALASALEAQAAELKARFNRDFWVEERACFALAIDGSTRRQVDSLTSNIGHLLWSGIVDDDKIDAVASHLTGPRLYSGWGVRTMAEGEGAYNPVGYHLGTVWPHDNSLIALGLLRAGHRVAATQIALDMLEAAPYFNHRLPEAFAGYARAATRFPVQYPTACTPQAWAAGAPLLMLRVLLGLQPVGDHLFVDPMIPEAIGRLELLDIPGRWGLADAFGRYRASGPSARAVSTAEMP